MREPVRTKRKVGKRFQSGWHEARVRGSITYFENQSEDDAVAEGEAAFAHASTSIVEVP